MKDLGSGMFGNVYTVQHSTFTNMTFALKRMEYRAGFDMEKEVAAMTVLRHNNVVKLLNYWRIQIEGVVLNISIFSWNTARVELSAVGVKIHGETGIGVTEAFNCRDSNKSSKVSNTVMTTVSVTVICMRRTSSWWILRLTTDQQQRSVTSDTSTTSTIQVPFFKQQIIY